MVNTSPTESVQALKDVNLREERCDGDNRDSALPCVPAEKAARAEIRSSQEDPATIAPAAKPEDRLVQNPSAEGVVSIAPKGFPQVSSDIDAHLDRCGHQPLFDSSKALDGERDASLHSSEDERLLTSAMLGTGLPVMNAELAEAIPLHRSDSGHSFSMEGQHPDSGLHLKSVPTDASARGSAAASTARDMVFGPSTKSKSVPLPKLLAELAALQRVVVSSNSSAHRGLAGNLQDERPGSAGRWSPVSDGSEAWLTCDEDLYYSEDEIEEELARQSPMEMPVPEQDRCSFGPPVAILTHCEKEWKGQTTESTVIRKGYAVLSRDFGFFRRGREDHYCALRASLYQTLVSSAQLPDWLQRESFLLIPEKLQSRYGLIEGWSFPDVCKQTSGIKDDVDLLRHYLSLLQKWWRAAAASPGLEGRRRVCDQLFQGGEDEFGVMEALKLLMLTCAVELHDIMQRGRDVPIFCWLLFSRYTSSCPRTFLANHLSRVGFSGGMEQVEMCLLGYTLHRTIKVYRLYMANMKDFIVTHYPDNHIQDWPSVCLVTEDGRHYDVAVGDPVCLREDFSGGPH
ncbi:ubiquitin thioesterase otulin-like [Sardina pilchardus]